MKQQLLAIFIFLTCSLTVQAQVQINSVQTHLAAAQKIDYSFKLIDEKTSLPITDKNLIATHTKILHLVVYDASLSEFNHVHPTFKGSQWSVELNLPVSGDYLVWAQGETNTGSEFSVSTILVIVDGSPEKPILPLGDVRSGVDGITKLELSSKNIKAGKMILLDFSVSHSDGTAPVMSPYLGAFAHVIATQLSGNELIHVHPMAGSDVNMGMLHATFPSAGEYRLWIQFNDNNVLKTIPLSVVVN